MRKKVLGIIFALIIAIISGICISKKVQQQNYIANLDAENTRAMNYKVLTDSDKKTQSDNVEFSAFFIRDIDNDGYADRLAGTCKNVDARDVLYAELNVKSGGYLKNGVITLEDNSNFYWSTSIVKDDIVSKNYLGTTNRIVLTDEVRAGSQKLLSGDIYSRINSYINNYTGTAKMRLKGTYVADDGSETPIDKEIEFNVDWYGNVSEYLQTGSQNYNITSVNHKDDEIGLQFYIYNEERASDLLLKDNVVTATIPPLNGYKATRVEVLNSGVVSEFNADSGALKITNSSKIDEERNYITSSIARTNKYNIKVYYPKEAYELVRDDTIVLEVPVEGYYTAFNNPNKEFSNPIQSNIAKGTIAITFSNPKGDMYNCEVYVGDYTYSKILRQYAYVMSKEQPSKVYDGIMNEEKDLYKVEWFFRIGDYDTIESAILKETKADEMSDIDGNKYSMEDFSSNVGIYFSYVQSALGKNGYINVYDDDTNELIHTFTSDAWNTYTKQSPYMYERPVKHIRVETSKVNNGSSFSVYNVKEIDDETLKSNISIDKFKNIDKVFSYLTGGPKLENGGEGSVDRINYANYLDQSSYAYISARPYRTGISEQEQYMNIQIDTAITNINEAEWKNGEFIVELPPQIISGNIRSISSSKPDEVKIVGYDLYEENGVYFIKVITENDTPTTYTINIDLEYYLDITSPTEYPSIKLYAHNKENNNYVNKTADIYDVNGNSNKEEMVGYSSTIVGFVAPSTLLTNQVVSNYDKEGNITVSPNTAQVKKEQRTANIDVNLINNYSNSVSDVIIVGEIPYESNTYMTTDTELGSQFTAEMRGPGIVLPEELKGNVDVYYSTNVNATKDLKDEGNLWTKTPEDWSAVKRYLIDFKDYVVQAKKSYTFTYEIYIPEGIHANEVSYTEHVVYFAINTDQGKLLTQTEPGKLGIRITEKYGINLQKFKKGTSLVVPGATYKIAELDNDNNEVTYKMLTTDLDGKIHYYGLLAGKKYKILELKSPENYELNGDEIIFEVVEDESGNFGVNILSEDTFAGEPTFAIDSEGNYALTAKVEDEPKYRIVLNKKDIDTKEALKNVVFKFEDENNVANYITDDKGQISINGLSLGKTYKITEIRNDDYYVDSTIREFSIVRNAQNKLELISTDSIISTGKIVDDETEDNAVLNINIQNEKIPTYSIEVLKVRENDEENVGLKSAIYKLTSKDTGKNSYYRTGEDGKLTIDNVYLHVDGKYITGEYTLEEFGAPEGYSINREKITFSSEIVDGELNITINNQANLTTLKDVTIEGNKIKLILQDKPLFKLTKWAVEEDKPLAGVKFSIYSITPSKEILGYAKDVNGNFIGTKDGSRYVIETDENGEIILALPGGYYKIVEVETGKEYYLSPNENDRTNYFKVEGGTQIASVEDLMDFIISINAGKTYENENIELIKTIDFTNNESYFDVNEQRFGDLNGDGVNEGLKIELEKAGFEGFKTDKNFKGTFNGNGNKILNFKGNYIFGSIENAEIKNLEINYALDDTDDIMQSSFIYKAKGSKITNCCSTGTLETNSMAIGLVVNLEDSKIENCYNSANITTSDAAGLIYNAKESTIQNCYNSGTINGSSCAVGIVSTTDSCELISNCYNLGLIQSANGTATGLIYDFRGSNINNCYNNGNITAIGAMAGLIGNTQSSDNNMVKNCYNTGNLTSTNNTRNAVQIGGIVAVSGTSIINCHNTGTITINNYASNNIGGIAGVVTSSNQAIINCYNTGTINATAGYTGGIAGLVTGDTDVIGCANDGKIKVNSSNSAEVGGIIGLLASGNEVKFCGNKGVIESAASGDAGGIVGAIRTSNATIADCCNVANISASCDYIGGISGYIAGPSTIKNVYNSGTIYSFLSSAKAGAIIGYCNAPINEAKYIYYLNGCAENTINTNPSIPDSMMNINPEAKTLSEITNIGSLLSQNMSSNSYSGNGYSFNYSWYNSNGLVVNEGLTDSSKRLILNIIRDNYGPLPFANYAGYNPSSSIYIKDVVLIPIGIDDSIDFSDATNVTINNTKKRFEITTEVDVNSDNERAGGTITGVYDENHPEDKYKQFVEEVIYGEDSLQEIKITPEPKYVVSKIVVNGQEINFVADDDGIVTLPIFEDVIENKHIKVIFEKDMSRVIVHHYLKDEKGNLTDKKVAEDQTYTGKIDTTYTTNPHMDLEKLSLEVGEDGEYILPDNAVGTYALETQHVNYYYVSNPVELIVHHYLDGTETSLVDEDEIYTYPSHVEFNEDGTYEVLANGKYDVSENENYAKLLEKYDLTIVTSTIKDIVNLEDVLDIVNDSEVTYYYRLKRFEITTEVKPHIESRTDELLNEKQDVEVKGGTISGENINPYEVVEYGYNSKNEIKVKPDKHYRVKTITLQSIDENNNKTETIIYGENADENAEIAYKINENGEVTLTNLDSEADNTYIFNNVTENKHIVVEFEPIPGTVIVHYYIAGTGEEFGKEAVKVPLQNGGVAEDLYKHDLIGESYITKEPDGVKSIYKLVSTSDNKSGKYTEDEIHVYYYYDYNDYEYSVEYYYENKETRKFDKDDDATEHGVVKYGEVIDTYTTKLKDGYALDRTENLPLTITEIVEDNVIKIYYRLAEYNYTVEYYYENKDSHEYVKDNDATEKISAEFNDIITSYKEKMKQGYELDKTEHLPLTITSEEDKNIIKIYYGLKDYKYKVNYFFDGVKDETLTEENTAEYSDIIEDYIDKIKDGYVFDKVDNLPLTITIDEDKNVINVFYITAYNITTDVIEHTEHYTDGTSKTIKGGTIDGEDLAPYEKVGKGKQNTKPIEMNPFSGYQIVRVLIDGEECNIKNDLSGNEIPTGYFTNMSSDKHIEVEYRKTSKVIVNHILKEPDGTTRTYKTEEIPGYEGKEYDTSRIVIDKYVDSEDEDGDLVPSNKSGDMKADTIIVNYYYEQVSYGIVERHIEVDEKGNERVIESTEHTGYEGQSINTTRKNYEGLIAVNCKVEPTDGIIAIDKSQNSKSVEYGGDITEVRYYYEKRFKITTEVQPHTEIKDGVETSVKGGSISGEGQNPYEYVLNRGNNSKAITITPDSGYRVKYVTINDNSIDFKENKNHIVTLAAGTIKDVQNDYKVVVEFERIPAKVIVKYVYKVTGEDLISPTEIPGFVGDEYTTTRQDIDNYFEDGDPENPMGTMTEEDIVVIYYYNKQFKITTDVIEHEELDKRLIELPRKEIVDIKTSLVKGGTISGEDEEPYEFVKGGEASTKDIEMKPNKNYQIVMIKINGVEQDLSKIVKDDGTVKLDYFTEMNEDKHIEVQYKKVTKKIVVKYLEEGTNKILAEEERATANIDDIYVIHAKKIDRYTLVKSPDKESGTINGDITEVYYYVPVVIENPKDDTDKPKDDIDEPTNINTPNNINNEGLPSYSKTDDNINSVRTGDNIITSLIAIILSVFIIVISKFRKDAYKGKHCK